jgi:hypothetical protein
MKHRDLARKFGLLVYNGTDNIGDEIQSLAARQFLPKTDYLFERDALHLTKVEGGDAVKVIMNGWFFKEHGTWPPPSSIVPLFVSFHLTPGVKDAILSPEGKAYFAEHGPVGTRDLFTLNLLRKAGVKSFFSGCLTLTLQRPDVSRDEDLIVLNDLKPQVVEFIRKRTEKKLMLTWHSGYIPTDHGVRSRRAEKMLQIYASASCVITSRLHCALPCIAMRTPVLLVDVAPDQERFSGLNNFCRHVPEAKLLAKEVDYDFDNPPPNPRLYGPYRENLIETARAFVQKT